MICWLDLETGGLKDWHPDIQVACIVTDLQQNEVASFARKIQFEEKRADPVALELNHYDPAVWEAEAVPESQAANELADFLQPYRLLEMNNKKDPAKPYRVARIAAHNASFDKPRMEAMFNRHRLYFRTGSWDPFWHPIWLDSVQRAMWWGYENSRPFTALKLSTVCETIGIPTDGAHDALADVRMSAAILKYMADRPRQEIR
jgi:hypothetical protein